ncbi:class I SAM-dependent methyltransferase [Paenibacillus sp. GCM10027627]|uniref:class I SAM-dependent methyltransferase n=1 Tax=unclassified Paenibacillus TaxID=185978 RepID=UPI003625A2CB
MDKLERFWDKSASRYDQLEIHDNETYVDIIERTKSHLKISDTVLDFGCGTGLISNEIAQNVNEVSAIDISSKMIEIAENKAKERNIANIDYAHATIFDEGLKKGSFDAILVFHVLHLLEDERIVLQRINELLKPGGLLISATPCLGEKRFLKSLLFLVSKARLIPKVQPFKVQHLVGAIEERNFSIVETDCLKESSREYFVVARKN